MNTIITIGREFGTGGHEVGVELAKQMGIPFYDKELLEKAAKESGLCEEIFEAQDEKSTGSFLFSLVMDTYSTNNYASNLFTDMPLNQKIFLAQFDAIKKIAQEGPCVMIGRCADYALESEPNVLTVFLRASLENRIKRTAALYGLKPNKAKDKIMKVDKSRASYYNYYTSKKWGAAESYDLIIDTAQFGIQGTIDLIKNAVAIKERGGIKPIYEEPFAPSALPGNK